MTLIVRISVCVAAVGVSVASVTRPPNMQRLQEYVQSKATTGILRHPTSGKKKIKRSLSLVSEEYPFTLSRETSGSGGSSGSTSPTDSEGSNGTGGNGVDVPTDLSRLPPPPHVSSNGRYIHTICPSTGKKKLLWTQLMLSTEEGGPVNTQQLDEFTRWMKMPLDAVPASVGVDGMDGNVEGVLVCAHASGNPTVSDAGIAVDAGESATSGNVTNKLPVAPSGWSLITPVKPLEDNHPLAVHAPVSEGIAMHAPTSDECVGAEESHYANMITTTSHDDSMCLDEGEELPVMGNEDKEHEQDRPHVVAAVEAAAEHRTLTGVLMERMGQDSKHQQQVHHRSVEEASIDLVGGKPIDSRPSSASSVVASDCTTEESSVLSDSGVFSGGDSLNNSPRAHTATRDSFSCFNRGGKPLVIDPDTHTVGVKIGVLANKGVCEADELRQKDVADIQVVSVLGTHSSS